MYAMIYRQDTRTVLLRFPRNLPGVLNCRRSDLTQNFYYLLTYMRPGGTGPRGTGPRRLACAQIKITWKCKDQGCPRHGRGWSYNRTSSSTACERRDPDHPLKNPASRAIAHNQDDAQTDTHLDAASWGSGPGPVCGSSRALLW